MRPYFDQLMQLALRFFSRTGVAIALILVLSACLPATPQSTAMTLVPTNSSLEAATAPALASENTSIPPSDATVQQPSATPAISSTPQPPTDTPLPTLTPTIAYREVPVAGIEVHNLKGVTQSVDAGVHWIRRNALRWDMIEPVEGERNWGAVAALEQEMQAIAEQGMEMILIIHYVPAWARAVPGYGCGPVAADKLDAFGALMHDVVARYSAPPYSVKFFEMGNEPDVPYNLVSGESVFGCWVDLTAPVYNADQYANMLKAVYPQVKAANPEAQVLIGGLLMDCDPLNPPQKSDGSLKDCSTSRFLEYILQLGGAASFDGVSFHAYDYYGGESGRYANGNWHSAWNTSGPLLAAKGRYLRVLLDYYNRPDAYLINTETALICGRDGREAICLTDDFARTKASYAVQANTAALAEGLLGNIWYSIGGWRGSDLLNSAGEPLPVYQAIRFHGDLLNGMGYAGRITDDANVVVYEFRQDGRRVWVLWSLDGVEHPITLPGLPSAAYDMLGNPLTPVAEWMAALWPVYLEWRE